MKNKKSQLAQEAREWNNWKPGSGRKGWSPFTKEVPPVRIGNIPFKDGKINMKKWEEELNEMPLRMSS